LRSTAGTGAVVSAMVCVEWGWEGFGGEGDGR
jgi:hypothetical protein